ncbi:MAG: 1-deoxy-D-xylulose-5-phosphate synthase [Gammaproteobacteria bacterium]|jgi:1-deoxy-D-xylulose-5-phosphate synthase|nr:1-deoxy-D-xylulose-5-phosphate synthase [Gammaproteobacteria bacterium]MBT7372059.1 1-deoxy-D-xylulose-5-phosphate synthase [Gammaproteobacteria bacterium]
MFNEIPTDRPVTPLLDSIDSPTDLKYLSEDELCRLSHELRHFLLYTVGQTGGHFGAGLGVVELTIAIHHVFDTSVDRLVWDVGHQTYPHKILTGRREKMLTLRQPDGLAPFPSRSESSYDVFGTGHSSTSISAALGLELAAKSSGDSAKSIVVIGDGAMTAGMAFEALNHVAACHADVLIILNDNAMSISENVGGLANYFARNISASDFSRNPVSGSAVEPGGIFTDLGFDYSGPIDGHDIQTLTATLTSLKQRSGPRLLHVLTTKGKGYGPAESSPVASHALTKLEKQGQSSESTYSNVFGRWICERASQDPRLVAITPAMKEGSDLIEFSKRFPNRFHDVAIAEQHAVTLAAGLAVGGAKPVVAIYSTFLQRAYDQLIHDVAIQDLDVLFAVDRASLLEDGPTHSGVFDLTFARAIPNIVVMTPADQKTMEAMLNLGFDHEGPSMVRYPRGAAITLPFESSDVELGKSASIRQGRDVAMLAFGSLLSDAARVADQNDYTLIDMRFVKPIDVNAIIDAAAKHSLLVTLEENVIAGGAGSAVAEILAAEGISTNLLILGIPDRFIAQDSPAAMKASAGLSPDKISRAIQNRLSALS